MTKASAPRIDIALCIDDDMVAPALVCLFSIAETADPTRQVRVFVVTSGDVSHLERMAPALARPHVEVVVRRVANPYALFPDSSYISAATYLRFLLPDLLDIDKVLYLDADVIVTRSLAPLFDTDIEAFAVAAVPDFAMTLGSRHQQEFKLFYENAIYTFAKYIARVVGLRRPRFDAYFNAGVLLVNLKEWRTTGFVTKVIDFLQTHPGLCFLDQDGLNHVCAGRYRHLDPRWNSVVGATGTMPSRWYDRLLPHSWRWAEICSIWLRDAWIIHFAGPTKPWSPSGFGMQMSDIWWAYAKRSPVASMFGEKSG